ncbi:cellulose-binding protein [Streptomyces radicis]|uniref:Cellulose-binding protein n=1 Tax=Streptomyces radicis TaxID=1750517 RepID=A0A3A9W778_9ACTN|nr:cellulose-binding protein [Streptomyces radicis]RKN08659.1 cellulose-binding protein [Streptomyces radicis]RKN21817.1 cellulose-binding protein [Streptomyces radicis]
MTGFPTARGRGYQPRQVDEAVAALALERDAAWRRLAELSLRVEAMAREAERLTAAVAALPPQTFHSLSDRARELLAEVEAEAAELRDDAETEAGRLLDAAADAARTLRAEAAEAAARGRAGADAAADATVAAADEGARRLLDDARRRAAAVRERAAAAFTEVERRCAALLADQRRGHAVAANALRTDLAAREAETDARVAELTVRADSTLERARRDLADAAAEARARDDAAEARRAELLADARVRRQRVERESEEVARDLEERSDQVRAHLAHIRTTLASLTGRTPRRQGRGPEGEAWREETGPAE